MAHKALKAFLYLVDGALHCLFEKRMTRKVGPGLPDEEIRRPQEYAEIFYNFGGWLSI